MLTTTLFWSPPPTDSSPAWTTTNPGLHNDWLVVDASGNVTTTHAVWSNGDNAEFPAAGTSVAMAAAVTVSGSGGPVYANQIEFLNTDGYGGATVSSYYNISATSGGKLEIPTPTSGNIGTTFVAEAGASAAFALPIISQSTGGLQTTGLGSMTIAAGATATFNNVTVGTSSNDTGTLDVEGTLNIAAGGSLTVTNGTTLEVNGTLNATSGGVTLNGSSILTGSGTIDLTSTASVLTYQSDVSSEFDGQITGPGNLVVDSSQNAFNVYATLTVGGNNSYSGGTIVSAGELRLEKNPTLGGYPLLGSGAVTIGSVGELDLNGCPLTVDSLNGSGEILDDSSGTNNSPVGATILTIDNSTSDGFNGNIDDFFGSGPLNAAIRLVKIGPGDLTLGGTSDFNGGTELDAGTITLASTEALGLALTQYGISPGAQLDLNDNGTLDLNGQTITLSSFDGNGGFITDNSAGGGTTTLTIDYAGFESGSHPSVFGGTIEDGKIVRGMRQLVGLYLATEGITIFTGKNTYTGGTTVEDGWLQVGDGTTNGSLTGPVYVGTQNGLTFDVATVLGSSGPSETFDGVILPVQNSILGSVRKTGPGSLLLTGDTSTFAGTPFTGNTYVGAMRVEEGSLQLGDSAELATGTQLIVDNGAAVDLAGSSTKTLQSVTLNNGSIVSTGPGATISASDSFNVANGTIGPGVTLAGTASLNKRTTGTVTFDAGSHYTYTGGTFVDGVGALAGPGAPTPSGPTDLYWNAPSGASWAGDNWLNLTTGNNEIWPNGTGDVAVLDPSYDTFYSPAPAGNSVIVSGIIEAGGITFNDPNFDIEDDGNSGSEIVIPASFSLVVKVAPISDNNTTATLGSVISGGGSLTKEGAGTLLLKGSDSSGNLSTYTGGSFVDAGTVRLGSDDAFGSTASGNTVTGDSNDLVVDDTGIVDLHGNPSVNITSLNSSYAAPGAPNGVITDYSGGVFPTTLYLDDGGTPGVFAGTIEDDPVSGSTQPVGIYVSTQLSGNGEGLLLTLTGNNTFTGWTITDGGLQIGDGINKGSITGRIIVSGGYGFADDVIFDVPLNATEIFSGQIESSGGGGLLKTGDGTLVLNGGNEYERTVVDAGTLQIADATALPVGSTVLVDGGSTLDFAGNSYTQGGALQSIVLNSGTIESTGGDATVDVTELVDLGHGDVSVNLGGPATLTKSPGGSGNVNGVPSDTVILTGENTYSGATFLYAGILNIQNGSALGVMAAGVYVQSGATLQLQGGIGVAAAGNLYLMASGIGVGPSLENVSGNNIWSGPIILVEPSNTGFGSIFNPGPLPEAPEISSDTGLLSLTEGVNAQSSGSPIIFGGTGAVSVSNVGISSNVYNVWKVGAGTLFLEAAGHYSGETIVEGGDLDGIISGTGILNEGGPSSHLTVSNQVTLAFIVVNNGATLDLGGYSVTVTGPVSLTSGQITDGALILDGSITSDPNTAIKCSLTYEGSSTSTIAGDITNGGSPTVVTIEGAGSLILSGANTYTGGTRVWAGILIINVASALPSGGSMQIGVNGPITFSPAWSTSAVQAVQAAGLYGIGNEIDIEVPMGQTVTVTGRPELALNLGASTEYAQYVSGSGTPTLTFQYFVQPGDNSPALDYTGNNALLLNGGTIENASGTAVMPVLSSPGSGNSISSFETLVVDTVSPAVTNIEPVGPATTTSDSVQFAVTFSKVVNNVLPADFALTGSGVTGEITSVIGGGAQYYVQVENISGTGTLGLNLVDDDSIVDAAGNPLGGPGAGNGSFSSGPLFLVVPTVPGNLTGGALSGAAYVGLSGIAASFTDTRALGYTAGDYSASIKWGDGAQTTGTVTYDSASQQFEINGSHMYAQMGSFVTEVFISDPNGLMAIVDGTAAIADAPLTAGVLTPPAAMQGNVASGQVLHFTDADPNAVAGQFSAVITWGDGSSSTVTSTATSYGQIVPDSSGGFDVLGVHRYFSPASGLTFSVMVTDAGGSKCSASDSSFSVAVAPLVADTLTLPPQGTASTGTVPLFTFTDMDPLHESNPPAYSATVIWGDGTDTVYTYSNNRSSPIVETWVGNLGEFTVYGSHTYSTAVSGATFSVSVTYPGGPSTSASDTLPTVTSIACAGSPIAPGATTLAFDVNFNEAVTGVAASDFVLSGGNSTGTISSVTGSGSSYVVTVTCVSGSGLLGLNFVNNGSVTNAFGTPVGCFGAGSGNFAGQQYALSSQFYWSGGSGSFGGDNWNVGSTTGPFSAWMNGANANIGTTAGTVTLSSAVTCGALDLAGGTLDLNGYSLYTSGLSGDGTVTNNGGATATLTLDSAYFQGVIEDGASPTAVVAVANEATFQGINTYTGGTTVDAAATLILGWVGATGNIAGNVVDSGSIWFAPAQAAAYDGNISGSGSVAYVGAWNSGEFTLGGNNTYAGGTIIESGTLAAGSASALDGASGHVQFFSGRLDLNGYGLTIGNISGDAGSSITNNGATAATLTLGSGYFQGVIEDGSSPTALCAAAADLILEGLNDYSGGTMIDAGATLILGWGGAGGSIAGNVLDDGSLWFCATQTGGFAGNISGGGQVAYLGFWNSGTFTLSGQNSYTGTTTTEAGTLVAGGSSALGADGGINFYSGTLDLNGYGITQKWISGDGGSTITNNGGASATLTLSGASYDGVFLGAMHDGSSPLALTVATGTLYIEGTASYTGGTTIDAGAELTVGWSGVNGSLSGDALDNGALVFAPTQTTVFAGNISGYGSVAYVGTWNPGTFTLSGDNTFTGGSTIVGGTLILGSADALGDSADAVLGVYNAMLDLHGQSIVIGSLGGAGSQTIANFGTVVSTVTNLNTNTTTTYYPS
jgi:fibronectin-binding autotransporter adhesin